MLFPHEAPIGEVLWLYWACRLCFELKFSVCFILLSQLKDMESLKDFGECIITIQACVIKKFLQGFMAPKQKKKKKQAGEESSKAEEVDEEKRLAEEARVRGKRWTVSTLMLKQYGAKSGSSFIHLKLKFWFLIFKTNNKVKNVEKPPKPINLFSMFTSPQR